jgi:transposase
MRKLLRSFVKKNELKESAIRDNLNKLSKEELIDIILRQLIMLEQLQEKNAELFKRVEELERTSHRQAAPFRIAEKKRVENPGKPGQKAGHKGYYRTIEESEVEGTIKTELPCCPYCKGEVNDIRNIEQIIEEIPEIKRVAYRLITQYGWCSCCQKEVYSSHPLQTSQATGAAKVQLGPQAKSLAMSLQYEYGMTKRKVCGLMKKVFNINFSAGGLVYASHRGAAKMEYQYESLCTGLRQSDVVHSDETSWYVGNPKYWLWVFANSNATAYHVSAGRGRKVIEGVLGQGYAGTLVSDCLSIYDDVNDRQQKCYSHHLKAIGQAIEKADDRQKVYLEQLKLLLKTALAVKTVKADKPPDEYIRLCSALEKQADALIIPLRENELEEKVANRLRKQRDHLFTFLYYDEVDATNNLAERQLRPAVIARKVSCGNKTPKGANTWQVMASIAATAQQRQQCFLYIVADAIRIKPIA